MAGADEELETEEVRLAIGAYQSPTRLVRDPADEILLLWAFQQPSSLKPNSFVRHSSLELQIESCGHDLTIFQSPSSMGTPGVTGAVMWDSGVVLGKFLENAVESSMLVLQGKKAVELGSGCGLVGCIAALLGAQVILTDMHDRLKLLKKNVECNLKEGNIRGSAAVRELTWGDDLDRELIDPFPDFILASDVVYSEVAVTELLCTLRHLCGTHTTIFLAGELRNDVVLEYFLEAAVGDFTVGSIDQTQWHPDYRSRRVAMFVLAKKPREMGCDDDAWI